MLKADPASRRQLADTGPLILWRQANDQREGLILLPQVCAEPTCPCRDVHLEGVRVSDKLLGVTYSPGKTRLTFLAGTKEKTGTAFVVSVNIDDGNISTPEGCDVQADPDAVAWLKSDLDKELLDTLNRQFQKAKRPPLDENWWRAKDWSWWEPGSVVGWGEVSTATDNDEVVLDGEPYFVDDLYCVDPSCDCGLVHIGFLRPDGGPDDSMEMLGEVIVERGAVKRAVLDVHGHHRPLVARLWDAYRRSTDVAKLVTSRGEKMKEVGAVLAQMHAERQPRKAAARVGPNQPCPCGSGKKYKKCHGRS